MSAFVDTSALLALLDRDNQAHAEAVTALPRLHPDGLLTHNYVIVETLALVQARLGLNAVSVLANEVLPLVEVQWVDETVHRVALAAVLESHRRGVSFVDRVSFAVMRQRDVEVAFAFDRDFRRQGFRTVP